MTSRLPWASWVALGSYILVHFSFLKSVPGVQLDESWSALYANKIAFNSGFWPIFGMTTYATAFVNYVTAGVFWLFGPSIWTYRALWESVALIGVLLIRQALRTVGEPKAAAIFPGVVAFFPAVVLNHRWAVEATTFFAFCTGLIALGLARRYQHGPSLGASALVVTGITLGIWSHFVFLPAVYGLWACLFLTGRLEKSHDRATAATTAALTLPFFVASWTKSPEPHKVLALVLLSGALVLLSCLPPSWLRVYSPKLRSWTLRLAAGLGCILLVPLALFLEGTWQELLMSGHLETPYLVGTSLLVALALIALLLVQGRRPELTKSLGLWCFVPLTVLITYCMVVKAGARYFEVVSLALAGALALGFARLRGRAALGLAGAWVLSGGLHLSWNYFKPGLQGTQRSTEFRLWRWHDGSGGFVPKGQFVSKLAAAGCRFEDLKTSPSAEPSYELRFYALGDWPKPGRSACHLSEVAEAESLRIGPADLK